MEPIPHITELIGLLAKARTTAEQDRATDKRSLTILFPTTGPPRRGEVERYPTVDGGFIDVHVDDSGIAIGISISLEELTSEADPVIEG